MYQNYKSKRRRIKQHLKAIRNCTISYLRKICTSWLLVKILISLQ